jgi:hypothetical protein
MTGHEEEFVDRERVTEERKYAGLSGKKIESDEPFVPCLETVVYGRSSTATGTCSEYDDFYLECKLSFK